MAVADKNPLGVVVIILAAEVFAAGIVHIVAGDRVAEPPAGAAPAAEDVGNGVAALHAALPGDEQRADALAVVLRPGEVHDAAHVEHHHDAGKLRRHLVEHVALGLGEVVAALLQGVLPVLAGGAPDDDKGGVRGFRGLSHHCLT